MITTAGGQQRTYLTVYRCSGWGITAAPDGACVMEFVSVLAGESWSDSPACTDRALAALARRINDDVGPNGRTALATLAPRLVGAVDRVPRPPR